MELCARHELCLKPSLKLTSTVTVELAEQNPAHLPARRSSGIPPELDELSKLAQRNVVYTALIVLITLTGIPCLNCSTWS